jgi:hypothetical protein
VTVSAGQRDRERLGRDAAAERGDEDDRRDERRRADRGEEPGGHLDVDRGRERP